MAKNFESVFPFKKKQKIDPKKEQRAIDKALGVDHRAKNKTTKPLSKAGLAALFAKNSK